MTRGEGLTARRWSTEARLTMALIALAYVAVLVVGLVSGGPMIGDEVQHYYMVITQAGVLPAPNVSALVPLHGDQTLLRYYPHVFLWHYLAAVLWRFLSPAVAVIQVYQSLFYLQLVAAAWGLIRCETHGRRPGAELLTVAAVASLPLALLFSVAFYQDIAAAAQLITALYLLRRGRWLWSAAFICVALSFKETILVAVPAYLLCVAEFGRGVRWRPTGRGLVVAAIVTLHTLLAIRVMGGLGFVYHPYCTASNQVKGVGKSLVAWWRAPAVTPEKSVPGTATAVAGTPAIPIEERRYAEVSHSPGDLRHPLNWLVFVGGVFWAVAGAGALGFAWARRRPGRTATRTDDPGPGTGSCGWLVLIGTTSLAITAVQMRQAPDARFFLPGMLCLLIALCRWASELPGRRVWLPLICVLAVLQSGAVLARTVALRQVPRGVQEAIAYLKDHRPQPEAVFMYPEGNARLFPCAHNWYLDYGLRDFWRAGNDDRLRVLHKFGLGAIVIKKYLVGPIDPAMNNLGVYPESFVRDIEADPRFVRVFDNPDVVIYTVPPALGRGDTGP